jgi:hypothetical protein
MTYAQADTIMRCCNDPHKWQKLLDDMTSPALAQVRATCGRSSGMNRLKLPRATPKITTKHTKATDDELFSTQKQPRESDEREYPKAHGIAGKESKRQCYGI